MVKFLQIIITLCCTSFFFFPFYPSVLPLVNTKMIMAACGLATLCVELSRKRSGTTDKDFLVLSLLATGVSMASFLSMVINDTPDNSYLSYLISMWVWIGAAYFMTRLIKWTHNEVSVELVCFYLIAVSTIQCIIAIYADMNAGFKSLLDSLMVGEGFMGTNESRMYGLGCALDVAGAKFSAVVVMIGFLLPLIMKRGNNKVVFGLLMISYFIIAFVGNMIGRTTIVGLVLSILYLVYISTFGKTLQNTLKREFAIRMCGLIAISLLIGTILYNTNTQWQKNIDFGFEGPISLIKTGKWEVKSNEMLMDGYKWPDNLHTWIIGDGYMDSTKNDPYYVGTNNLYWYAGTDAGYCRFIFYFGLFGLSLFTLFMFTACCFCRKKFPKYKSLFLIFFVINMIVWLKVSTDIFLVFAPFLCIAASEQEEYEKSVNAIEQT